MNAGKSKMKEGKGRESAGRGKHRRPIDRRVYEQAGKAVAAIVKADRTKSAGRSLRSLTLAPQNVAKKATHALTCETLRYLAVIQDVVSMTPLKMHNVMNLQPYEVYVVVYDLLFGCKDLPPKPKSTPERAVANHKSSLRAALARLLVRHRVASPQELVPPNPDTQAMPEYPRYARINTLKATKEMVLQALGVMTLTAERKGTMPEGYGEGGDNCSHIQNPVSAGTEDGGTVQPNPLTETGDVEFNGAKRARSESTDGDCETTGVGKEEEEQEEEQQQQQPVVKSHKADERGVSSGNAVSKGISRVRESSGLGKVPVKEDEWLDDVLVFPHGTDLHVHPLVTSGQLILQGWASCIPAIVLSPEPHWHVLDACAAPGSKTTHLSALLQHTGRVTACERDAERAKVLRRRLDNAGATNVSVVVADFLSLDPKEDKYNKVDALLVDPSCSGSGTTHQRMDHLLPSSSSSSSTSSSAMQHRLEGLARFQEAALSHALKFPSARRVVYSTCSTERRENESVVAAVLPLASSLGFHLARALPAWSRRGLPSFSFGDMVVRVDPKQDKSDGFFVALFERSSSLAAQIAEGGQHDMSLAHTLVPTQTASLVGARNDVEKLDVPQLVESPSPVHAPLSTEGQALEGGKQDGSAAALQKKAERSKKRRLRAMRNKAGKAGGGEEIEFGEVLD